MNSLNTCLNHTQIAFQNYNPFPSYQCFPLFHNLQMIMVQSNRPQLLAVDSQYEGLPSGPEDEAMLNPHAVRYHYKRNHDQKYTLVHDRSCFLLSGVSTRHRYTVLRSLNSEVILVSLDKQFF